MVSAKESALSTVNNHELRVECFCEENVWRLAAKRKALNRSTCINLLNENVSDEENKDDDSYGGNEIETDCVKKYKLDRLNCKKDYVIFISNPDKCCAMLHQKAAVSDSAAGESKHHIHVKCNSLFYILPY